MIFNHKIKDNSKSKTPDVGDKRTVAFFAFLPRRIGHQTRWLEMISIEQRYGCGKEPTCIYHDWQDLKFVIRENTDGYEKQ